MKLNDDVLNLLLNKQPIRFITQPDKDGFYKAVVVGPLSHVYSLERLGNLNLSNYLTSNNIMLDGVNKDYKTIMSYLKANHYEAM